MIFFDDYYNILSIIEFPHEFGLAQDTLIITLEVLLEVLLGKCDLQSRRDGRVSKCADVIHYLVLLRDHIIEQQMKGVDRAEQFVKLLLLSLDRVARLCLDLIVLNDILPSMLCQRLIVVLYKVSQLGLKLQPGFIEPFPFSDQDLFDSLVEDPTLL